MSEKGPRFIPDSEKKTAPEKTQADSRLSPEIEAMVMKKVSDINEKGNVFTSVRGLKINYPRGLSRLKDIFELGLVGGKTGDFSTLEKKQKISNWHAAARAGESKVWANIVGRDISQVSDAYWLRLDDTDIGIVFGLDKFKEKVSETSDSTRKGTSRSFRASGGSYIEGIIWKAIESGFDPNGSMDELKDFVEKHREKLGVTDETMKYLDGQYLITEPQTGFVVSHRVAPKFFRGIVFRPVRSVTVEGIDEFASSKIEYDDPATVDTKLQMLIDQMTQSFSEKPELLTPIYDQYGNLLWPRKMSYAEVRKLDLARNNVQDEM